MKVLGNFKIKKYLDIRLENKMLRKKIRELPTQEEYINRIRELEYEVRILKIENKNLKKDKQ
jgi:hypothetical protein